MKSNYYLQSNMKENLREREPISPGRVEGGGFRASVHSGSALYTLAIDVRRFSSAVAETRTRFNFHGFYSGSENAPPAPSASHARRTNQPRRLLGARAIFHMCATGRANG